jgi:predicted HTH transcriptional regulator
LQCKILDDIELAVDRLGSIAKNNLAWSIQLEHAVVDYKGHALLFVRIPEQTNKPIYMRGKDIYEAYIRSAGHSVKMSREQLAQMMLQLDMCERRGSGYDRATDAIAQMKLPAYKAQSGDDFTRVTIYPKKKGSEMTREERIQVCYQHACLLYEDGLSINNQIVRERFNLNTKQSVMASRILSDTLESGLIKMKNPETESKRYTSYIPFYG